LSYLCDEFLWRELRVSKLPYTDIDVPNPGKAS
jgi:hypothetical protein